MRYILERGSSLSQRGHPHLLLGLILFQQIQEAILTGIHMVAGSTKMHDALHRKSQIMNFHFPQLCETLPEFRQRLLAHHGWQPIRGYNNGILAPEDINPDPKDFVMES
ncbi:hypothetical protein DTO164E3_3077 [Paecilomyces variotii]|nr:hypothetical protein DTO164E3_3077 [Paecilomyces variotii]KAJ9363644.1 hypothetical protein DTO280E4_2626 [Paecilomyces variotii]